MKKNFLFLILFHISFLVQSQNPTLKSWDYRYGGDNDDYFHCVLQTNDAVYILAGSSFSGIGGDKTQAFWGGPGNLDFWIVKIDSLGIKQWDKRFGGFFDDELYSIQQTNDGGYIIGGGSNSPISGDKTQGNWDMAGISKDYWIVKINSLGVKQWDKRFGGTDWDYFSSLQQTDDEGYILGGYSLSGIGGDKTQDNWDTTSYDYWVIKIDSTGNKQWDKRFGGTKVDLLYTVQQTIDRGYILGGVSNSRISGDKSEPTFGPIGDADFWIVKTDSLGIKEWDKDFGGIDADYLSSLKQTVDGGYILGGKSFSGVSGNKTQANQDTSGLALYADYWIIKTDSSGNIQWDKDFGGIDDEERFWNVAQTSDYGYLLTGASYSNAGGDKTENNLGAAQTWIIKTNSIGIKQWDKTIFTSGVDDLYATAIETIDGCFAVTSCTFADTGGYKSQPSWGGWDYWVVKFCDSAHTGVEHPLDLNSSFIIFPNPTTSTFTINSTSFSPNAQIEIHSLLGEKIFSAVFREQLTVNCEHFPPGLYFVSLKTENAISVRKLIKQ